MRKIWAIGGGVLVIIVAVIVVIIVGFGGSSLPMSTTPQLAQAPQISIKNLTGFRAGNANGATGSTVAAAHYLTQTSNPKCNVIAQVAYVGAKNQGQGDDFLTRTFLSTFLTAPGTAKTTPAPVTVPTTTKDRLTMLAEQYQTSVNTLSGTTKSQVKTVQEKLYTDIAVRVFDKPFASKIQDASGKQLPAVVVQYQCAGTKPAEQTWQTLLSHVQVTL